MAVPWNQIIRWAPQIIVLSRELLKRAQRTPPSPPPAHLDDRADLQVRIAALEDNERAQAELVERMAEQQAELASAVLALHRRERLLMLGIGILAALVVWLIFR
jgi:hypothetical protein